MAIMSLKIRPATEADTEVVADFNRRMAWETEHKILDPVVLTAGVRAILTDASKGWYFVAEEDGQLLGQLMLTFEWSDWRNAWFWWIQSVYILPEARRTRLYSKLYEFVKTRAAEAGNICGF